MISAVLCDCSPPVGRDFLDGWRPGEAASGTGGAGEEVRILMPVGIGMTNVVNVR